MKMVTLPAFELTGLHIHTTWEHNQAKHDIAKLWKRFYLEDIPGQLDFSVDDTIYLLYTDYVDGGKQGFSVWLGMQTAAEAPLPSGFRRLNVLQADYYQLDAASDLPEAMQALWEEVDAQAARFHRIYRCDIECYPDGEHAQLLLSTSDKMA